uniref:uncharacterized protein LOC122600185 n=1 Tax=Erigeron canadensis TaxID=72917 RepID=UPI001CB90121|nr:uncharacterized protein LOC122600185 [Erigeron canadensis]XP_043628793.1 uncharacterized protein LOC122600185 [Erigeron canadensis]
MGQDIELDFEKYCVVDGSPKTVLSPRHSKIEKKKVRKKPKCINEVMLSQNKEFREISLNRYRSASCRDVRSTRFRVSETHKRGSVYQSSHEVGKMNQTGEEKYVERKKIELSRSDGLLPREIFDSLCGPNEDLSSFLEVSLDLNTAQDDQPAASTPLHKSLSSRLEQPHSPTKLETDSSKTSSPKTRFTPFKKMFDPFVKSKSQKNQNITSRKSLIDGFTNTDYDSKFLKKDSCSSIVSTSCSPSTHLNGVLKLGNKNRMPYFEFLVQNPFDVLVAKTQKGGDGCNWVYTFYTVQHKRKISGKDNNRKDLTTVGQMRVSCYLCTELVNAGAFDNIMVTEFVLYDLARPRKFASHTPDGVTSKEIYAEETCRSNESMDQLKVNVDKKYVADLHPDLETAAIVIQFPSEKRESLKCNREDIKNDGLFNLSKTKLEKYEAATVSVVIPSANHGLPSDGSRGPSPLLDRWRLCGGCDCGGWDMGCPLIVLGNLNVQKEDTCKEPVKLFLKGTKEKIPALIMKMSGEGQYAVEFHAQLTSLQAFSICIAILHSTEGSIIVAQDSDREMLQCDSLRVFAEDEVKHLIEAVVEEDKRKPAKNEIPPSFLVNPPFSPMSRV